MCSKWPPNEKVGVDPRLNYLFVNLCESAVSTQQLIFQRIEAHNDIVHQHPSSAGRVVGGIRHLSLGVVVRIPAIAGQPLVIFVIDLCVQAVA